MDSISQIQNNPDIKADAKATLIANVQAGFTSFATFWESTSGVDVSALLNFAPLPESPGNSESDAAPPRNDYTGGWDGRRWIQPPQVEFGA